MNAPPAPAEQLTSAMVSIQQSFTAEASAILTAAVSDATRRRHPNVTPLHVAASLLSSPSSLLRRTCTMHQQQFQHRSMHPFLSCRALDLCFSVALDRIPSIHSNSSAPIFSNALVASLKRAQAIQRRGSPDHPLLAIRVDLPHLTISILDDPSVSRVMGEAGFSSPKVKSYILTYTSPRSIQGREIGLGVGGYRHEIKRVADVLMRQQKRNPVLVGDSGVDSVMEDILGMMRRGEFGNLNVISVGDSLSRAKTNELPDKIRGIAKIVSFKLLHDKGVVLDLGDLKWLVEGQNSMEERGRALRSTAHTAISEVALILRREGRMWVVGTASCATYLKCQVYHPNMERDWDLQALPVAFRSSVGVSPSFVADQILSTNSGVVPLSWHSEKRTSCCEGSPDLCSSRLKQHDDELSCHVEGHQLELFNRRRGLNGLLNGPLLYQGEENLNETIIEVSEKRQGPCQRLQYQLELMPTSPGSNSSTGHPPSQSFPTELTDLSLGLAPFSARDQLYSGTSGDAESEMGLSKGLLREVNWQPEAAMSIASAVAGIKSGSRKRYGHDKSDTWLLFNGPDDIGKRKLAHALSMLVFSERPATFNLSPRRGTLSELDLMVEAVKTNPMRVIVLDGIDHADAMVRKTIKNTIATGRLGGLGNTIFVLIVGSEQAGKEIEPVLRWHLELSVGPNTMKRRAERDQDHGERRKKARMVRRPLSLDLNLCTGSISGMDDDNDGSDLTEENGHSIGQVAEPSPVPPSISDIYHLLDGAVDFKPFDPSQFERTLSNTVSAKFASVMGAALPVEIEMRVLDQMADVVLHGDGGILSFEQWADEVFVPAVEQLKSRACLRDGDKIHLSLVKDQPLSWMPGCNGSQLPISVTLAIDAA